VSPFSQILYFGIRVSRIRRTLMAVRIVLADKEPIRLALKRFKKHLERNGFAWEIRRRRAFVKKTKLRRAKKFKKRFKTRLATMQAKRVGEQPTDLSASELLNAFRKKSGKP
jgi:ribosomal protein S21